MTEIIISLITFRTIEYRDEVLYCQPYPWHPKYTSGLHIPTLIQSIGIITRLTYLVNSVVLTRYFFCREERVTVALQKSAKTS